MSLPSETRPQPASDRLSRAAVAVAREGGKPAGRGGVGSARRREQRGVGLGHGRAWGVGLLLAAVSVGLGLWYNPPEPHFDELYHVLAAQSVLSGEGLAIGTGGYYDRAWGYTYAVAGAMALAGETLEASRWPSMVCLAAAVALVCRWVWGMAGPGAAVAAGLVTALMPGTLFVQGMTRFYTPQLLFVMIAAWLVYRVTVGEVRAHRLGQSGAGTLRYARSPWLLDRADVVRLALAAGFTLLGLHMQPTTVLPAAGLAAWFWAWWGIGLVAGPAKSAASPWGPQLVWVAGTLLGLTALGVVIKMDAWSAFRSAAAWSAAAQNDPLYYHDYFMSLYGGWWVATPLLALAAVARGRIAVVFVLILLQVSLAGQSLSGMKAPRYVVYLSPWLAMIWAIGAVEISRLLRDGLRVSLHMLWRGTLPSTGPVRFGPGLAVALAVVPLIYYTPATFVLRRMLDQDATTWHRFQQTDWAGLAEVIRPTVLPGDTVISSAETKALFYLGRLDIALGVSQLVGHAEGEVDPRTGAPTISSPESIARAVAASPTGLIVIETATWRTPYGVPDETANRIDDLTTEVALPSGLAEQFVVRRWGVAGTDTPSTPLNEQP